MPRLWNETIEAHRHDVRHAITEAAWRLVQRDGLLSVTMAHIAQETGIGRATLYKYFPNVEAILVAHHDRHVTDHLRHLTNLGGGSGDPVERLAAVAAAYASIRFNRQQHASQTLSALLHRDETVVTAERQVRDVFLKLLDEVAAVGRLGDGNTQELANYCVHALGASGDLSCKAAVDRLVAITLRGLLAD